MSVGITAPKPLLPTLATPLYPHRGRGSLAPLLTSNHFDRRNGPFLGSGRSKPPAGDMSATYQPSLAAYDSHGMHNCSSSAVTAARAKAVAVNDKSSPHGRCPTQYSQTQGSFGSSSQSRNDVFNPVAQLIPTSRHSTRPSTPTSEPTKSMSLNGGALRRGSETLIYHSLQIPRCISPNGGNLAEFAAQMTCLFWFESAENLKIAETINSRSPLAPIPRLPMLAKPYEQFRKWVYNVLSTTQVTQNVIILALLFIYRLKMSTPQIKGRAGSEYRLLTVALMLGNKFLDDNTYTNKTWAEVSCFAVQEIHVMEVEFLSNMRYNLLASHEEWDSWLLKLANFREYYERALKLPASPIHPLSQNDKIVHSPTSSPTATTLPTFPGAASYGSSMPINVSPNSSQSQNWSAYQTNIVSPLASKPTMTMPLSRKRSPEDDLTEHPAKRQAPPRLPSQVPSSSLNPKANSVLEASKLPTPHLTVVTNQQQKPPISHPVSASSYTPQSTGPSQNLVALPPLQLGVRAMSTVYQPSPVAMLPQQQQQQQQTLPTTASVSLPTTSYPSAPLPAHPAINYGTPTKRHSPGSLAPYGSSPMVDHFSGPASAVHTPLAHTPISNSPSFYLQQRASPYKPIRHVNRLLYPPPSASLDQYHLAVPVQPTQMHYQPLGRRNDVRTGVVPEFVVFNRGQHQTLTPQPGSQTHYGHQGPYPS